MNEPVPPEPASVPPLPRWAGVLLAVLLAGSLAVRVVSAQHVPTGGRFFDERYTLQNVESLLRGHQLRPRNGFYLAFSYLPQSALLALSEALHRATGAEALAVFDDRGRFTPTARVLCRLLGALCGVAGLAVLFQLGRRLWGPAAGLLAASLLAATSRHLRSSVEYKPDIWVVTLTLVAFAWAMTAGERPARRRFLRAGVGTGLAVSAKYTGIVSALPVAVAGLARGGWRQPRRWGWLLLSGAAALLTYVALNPYLGVILPYVPRVMAGYVRQSHRQGLSHSALLLREPVFLVDNLGPAAAALAVAGLVAITVRAARRWRSGAAMPVGELMIVLLIAGYSLFYAAATPLFRGQNYLPVVPFVCLLAALGAVTAGALVARRLPSLARLAPAAVTALVLAGVASQAAAVYATVVPITWLAASRQALATAPRGGQLVGEATREQLRFGGVRRAPLVIAVADLPATAPDLLDGADVELFPSARLSGSAAAAYQARAAAPGTRREDVGSRLFRTRGEPVTLLVHPWQPVAADAWAPVPADGAIALPPVAAGERLSLEVLGPSSAGGSPLALALTGGRVLTLQVVGDERNTPALQTVRFVPAPGEKAARLQAPAAAREELRWRCVRWRRAPVAAP